MPPTALIPPTTELGSPGLATWAGFLESWEDNKALRWPAGPIIYDRMRTDGQVAAMLAAGDLAVMRNGRRLGGDGVDPRVISFVADELGLDLDPNAAGRRRRRGEGVVFLDAHRHALLSRVFGFMPLEQVYRIGPPGPGQEGYGLPAQAAHLRKLAPRMPRSILGLDVADDGGLEAVRQSVYRRNNGAPRFDEVRIPADRVAMFCHRREGGDWYGRSDLRAAYGPWLLKTAMLKLGPMMVERNGMAVPVVTYGPEQSRDDALAIAKAFRAGEESGAALPLGMALALVAPDGTPVDSIPYLNYYDQAIGRAGLAMFLNLGHDNGARSLGESFVDYFLMSIQALAEELNGVWTEHIIRDLVEANYGPDEPYPVLVDDELGADSAPTAEALKALADAGLLDGDPDVKAEVRRMYRLPAPSDEPVAVAPGADLPRPAGDVDEVTELPPGAAVPPGMTPDELLKMVNAAASLIRSGFAPDASLLAVGLSPIDHLGLLPVTVQRPEEPVAGLSAPRAPGPLDVARALAAVEARHSARAALSAPPAPSPADRASRAAQIAERAAAIAARH